MYLIVEGFDVKAIRAKLVEMNLVFEKDEKSLVVIKRLLAAKSSDRRGGSSADRSVDPDEGEETFR